MVDLKALADEAGDAVNVDTPAPQPPVNHVEGNQPMVKETSAMDAMASESQANAHLALSTPDKVTLEHSFFWDCVRRTTRLCAGVASRPGD